MKKFYSIFAACMLSVLVYAQSDVDTRIAVNDTKDYNTFVLIISNENYKYEQTVPFALNDGETFKLYCEKTLGIPERHIRYAGDATLNDMRMQLQWLIKVMKAYEGDARAIIYYSGHGMPSEDGKHAYLLPVDGKSLLEGSGLSTASLFKELGNMPSKATIVFLDACFSGARRDGNMLASSRGVAIRAKQEPVNGHMVVFSAAQGDETAYSYIEKQHGLFTYYLLEQMQAEGGNISLGDLVSYVKKMVGRTSIVENDRSQTPTVTASSTSTNWRKWVLANKRASKYETVKRTTPITQITPTSLTSPAVPVTSPAVAVASPAPVTPTAPLITQPDISQPKEPDMVIAVGNVQFKMIPVKGGMFTMGATPEQGSDASSEEKPAHNVKLDDYYIAETEVTQELWETVMGDNPSHFKGGTLPVETVSWEDCQQFIKKLNELTGMSFRLPTEAEWEYAARGGNQSKGYKYSGSDKIKNVAWFDGNSAKLTHNVKTKKPNELGIYDMSGNVWEWCQDWYKASYDTVLQTNPQGPNSGTFRARRGGGWYYNARDCRVSNRANHTPSYRSFTLGLRLALSPQI